MKTKSKQINNYRSRLVSTDFTRPTPIIRSPGLHVPSSSARSSCHYTYKSTIVDAAAMYNINRTLALISAVSCCMTCTLNSTTLQYIDTYISRTTHIRVRRAFVFLLYGSCTRNVLIIVYGSVVTLGGHTFGPS